MYLFSDEIYIDKLESRVSTALLLLYLSYGILVIASAEGSLFAIGFFYSMILTSAIIAILNRSIGPIGNRYTGVISNYYITGVPAIILSVLFFLLILAVPLYFIYLAMVSQDWTAVQNFEQPSALLSVFLGLLYGYIRCKIKKAEKKVMISKYSATIR